MKELVPAYILLVNLLLTVAVKSDYSLAKEVDDTNSRESKVLPVFQVVRFPNDPCSVTGGSKNGTCYTVEECSTKGGTNAGSCASGFGVCCTFTLNCGAEIAENCTYFDSSTTVNNGACEVKICKCSSNICQVRLDFQNFVISGPSTISASVGKMLNGNVVAGPAMGTEFAEATRCLTDTFTITNQANLPSICGVNSGYHVYFEASDSCNNLNFQLGNVAQGIPNIPTRSWSMKVTQYSCDYENLAPVGCDQWHFGSGGTNFVQTFNYQSGLGTGRHLNNQHQNICVRREAGMCRICWSANEVDDVGVTGQVAGKGVIKGSSCCAYKSDGVGPGAMKGGGDCVLIPGAQKADDAAVVADKICGTKNGLVTASIDDGTGSKTICSTQTPFRISFHSDNFEFSAADEEATGGNPGFQLRYFQTTC